MVGARRGQAAGGGRQSVSADGRTGLLLMDEIKAAFAVFDVDKSGNLSAAELRAILTRGATPILSAAEVDEVIAHFDKDGSGSLSVQEFAEACFQLDDSEAEIVRQNVEAAREEQAVAANNAEHFGASNSGPPSLEEAAAANNAAHGHHAPGA